MKRQYEKDRDLFVPRWERTLLRKHAEQMTLHESKFGKLGEVQTKAQKNALRQATAQQKKGV